MFKDFENGKLYKGDCLEVMKELADKSVDLILCDLPYGSTKNKWDSIIPFDALWEQYERVIKPKGNIVLFGAGLFAFQLALSNTKLFRYDMVWKKSKCGSPLTAKYMPLKKHEMIMVFGKSAATYNPQMVEGKPYKRTSKQGVNNMGYGAKSEYSYGSETGERHPDTILDFAQKWRRQDQKHPTEKPVPLFEWLIRAYSNESEIVLDNCAGSGTTGIAAINTSRKYILIEKEENYFDLITDRIEEHIKTSGLI
jgi:site-specific DNA-methyltransferase (adenine-specific)